MALMTDPLAANLFVIGIMFIGFAGYVLYRFIMKKQNTEVDSGFGKGLEGTKTIYIFRFNGKYYLAERTFLVDEDLKALLN